METQYVAQENARRFQDRYPLAAETALKSTYMDDSSNIGTVRSGFLRWQRMAAQGRRIIKNSGRRTLYMQVIKGAAQMRVRNDVTH